MITENIKKNPDNPAWTVAARRWDAIVTWAEDTSGAYYTDGKPGHLPTVKVAGAVLRVAPAATADEVWKTVVALTLMREFEPGRFHSDDGFRFEVARHVRNLGSSAAGTRYVPELGKTKPVYRDPAPDTLRTFGQTLIEAFGPLGLRIAERVREGLAEEREKKAEWKTALAALR